MMFNHQFEGDGLYCKAWIEHIPFGNLNTTGQFTMTTQCSYPRWNHPDTLESDLCVQSESRDATTGESV